jgi:hypothetical protein
MKSDFEGGQDSRLRRRYRDGGSGFLVVVFSQVRVPAGKFGLERLFARTRHSCLFLNDTENSWYLGLEDEIDTAIQDARNRTDAEDTVYYGSSMGGYGALVTGLRRMDGSVHSFGAELRAGAPGSQSRDYGIGPEDTRLLDFEHAATGPGQPIHLYYGIHDPVDAANAAAAAHLLPAARLHLLQSCHASHDHLYSLNLIRRIITTFARDPKTELASKNLIAVTDPGALKAFGRLAERLAAGHPIPSADVAALPDFPRNPGMMRLAAEAAALPGDYAEAIGHMEQAEDFIEASPVLRTTPKRWRKEFPLRRVEFLLKAGKPAAAETLLRQTCERFPVDHRMKAMARSMKVVLPEPATESRTV